MTPAPDPTADAARRSPAGDERAPGHLVVTVGDTEIDVDMDGGGAWTLPLGVRTLVEGPLERSDRPRPEQLTNALGAVADHLDDVLIDAPIVASTPQLVFAGEHVGMVARVEAGLDAVPTGYELRRADVDEVFRTIVAEPRADRLHNPGLDPAHVDTVVAGCCAVLAFFRRLDHQLAKVAA